ncbi:MAG: CBS domain-containing protein [Deltaproteobacteria bacterium]|nr:CBS domain-containing protein [Deltaproteobacteria bacterium]
MVPIEEYATVSVEATLYDAVTALEKAQEELDRSRYHYLHRAVLVFDENDKIVGKISQLDVLKALEPKYREMGEPTSLSKAGFSNGFLRDMLRQYSLWDKPLADICSKGSHIKVRDFMYTPTEGEYVDEEATLEEGIHMLVVGRHHSLLVTRKNKIVGVLRLTDVFNEIFQRMKTCRL